MIELIRKKITMTPLVIALVYALFASLWIILSDEAVEYLNIQEHLYSSFQTLKGLVFVIITAILVYIMTNRSFKIQNHLIDVLDITRDVNQLIVREKNQEKLLQSSCDILASNHVYENVWIIIFDEENLVNNIVSSDTSENFIFFKHKVEGGWTPHCIRETTKIESLHFCVDDKSKTCLDCPLANLYNGKSVLNIKLKHENSIYGYINISIDKEYINDKSELSLLYEIAGDIAYAIYNMNQEKALVQSNIRYKSLYKKNEAIQERLTLVLEGSRDGIWDWDIPNNKLYFSPRWKEMLGYRDDELENTFEVWDKFVHPDDKEQAYSDIKMSQEGKTNQYRNVHRLRHKDGHWIWIDDRGQTIFDENNKPIRMIGSHTDITKEKEYENTIVQIKELYENIISSVDNLIFVKNNNFEYVTCNSAFEKFIGKSKEELIGKNDYDFLDKEVADNFRSHDEKLFIENKAISSFNWVTYPDGKKAYLLTTISPLRSSNKNISGLVGNSVDVTQQQKTLQRLKEAQSFAKLGSWEYNIKKDEVIATEELYNIYGVTDLNMKLKKYFFYKHVHPDDKKKIKERLRKTLPLAQGNILHNRIIRKDNGQTRYLEHRWSTRYKDGVAVKFVGTTQDITQHIKMQTALNESEEKFRLLIEQSPFVIEIYDINGLQIEVNKAYEKLWGFPAQETLHKFNVLKSEEVKRTGLIEYINKAYAGEYVDVPIYEYDSSGKTEAYKKGRKRSLSTKIFPLKNKNNKINNIVITHEDVTEQEETRKLLEDKSKELETTIQEAPNPIMLHNEAGEIILVNKVWKELTGYKHSEINSVSRWIDVAYNGEKAAIKKHISQLYTLDNKIDEGEHNIITKDKKTLVWQFSSAPLGIINNKRTVITSAMDITELKHKDAVIRIQSRHAAMGEMIGMIAHQWRQPISVIAMAANNMLLDIMLDDFDPNKAEKVSQTILQQTSHLSKTIDDFRNFFKPDKEVSKVKLQNIMEETISIVKESLKNNHIKLTTSYNSDSLVDAYSRELMQVFVNIINNSKDAILSNKIKEPTIQIKIYDDEKYVNTEICDNAKGIDDNILTKIFEPYFTTKDEKTGTGLGLYMSKMIVEDHLHGMIEVYNDAKGACFRIKLLK
jgi:PAS domain S-box-containing protein